MKERFFGAKGKVAQAVKSIDRYLTEALGLPEPYEVVVSQFVHKSTCSRTRSLIKIEEEEALNLCDGGVWGINTHPIFITQKYVECGECHEKQKYRE